LARTFRCASSGAIPSLADLKGLRQPNFFTPSELWVKSTIRLSLPSSRPEKILNMSFRAWRSADLYLKNLR
ncbi:MAG TPA: hypothetical protein VMG63_23450, partial [Terriglobia bacterium]|nr:hypothetical protein [Terriglobia bacterium]